ncbi:unnamed protein product [Parnassius mnemosyne]|uniref:DDE-1 domain-containing protein n=1 Tax=Parnassius mnemosyne TaxID=213953 RepID=A0AAV1L0J1_9NEOP
MKGEKRRNYDSSRFKEAYMKVIKDNWSVYKASKEYGIPWSTLRRHIATHGGESFDLPKLGRPFTLDSDLEFQAGKDHQFNDAKRKAGPYWWWSFKERYGLSLHTPEKLAACRAVTANRQNIDDFYKKLLDVVIELDILQKPERIYNCDETGVTFVVKPSKIVTQTGKKVIYSRTFAEKGVTQTVLGCCSASGASVPPLIIFKGVRMVNDLANGAPEGSIVRLSKNGWINSELFLEWMHHFEAHIPPARPVLLIMDSHSTHVSQDVIDFATKNGIHLFTFPSHTSHLLQPLDVSVYKSLKNAWAKVLNDYKLQHPTSAPTRLDFCRLLTPAYEHAFQPSIIMNGFRKTGIAPFDRNAISDESIAPSLMQPSDLQSQNIESSTDNAQASAVNRETASPSVFSLLSVPEVPQSSSSSTRRAKRNPQARYLTPQSTNNMDSPEENIVAISNETTVAVTSEETVTSIRVPSASPTPGPSTESNLKRKLPRVKVEKTPKSNKSTMCDYCGVHYSQDVALRNGAMSCGKWYHQECTGTESPQFLCDNCDKVDFSGTDDSDWAPE